MRCTYIKTNGERCRAYALKEEDKCLWHSNSEKAIQAKGKRRIFTNEEMIVELQRLARRIKQKIKDPLEASREIRLIFEQISQLKGEKNLSTKEEKAEFQKRIEKWKTKSQT